MACQRHHLLITKSDGTINPKNFRPITCFTTMYNILTSILTKYTYSFPIDSGLFPDEQKGCKRGSYDCKDQLLINKVILENCHNRNIDLSIAWTDYKKAFWIVCLIHGLKNVLKRSKYHLSYPTFSLTPCACGK